MTLSNGPNESCEWPPDPKEHKPQVPSCNSRDAWDHQHHHKLVSSFVFTVYHLELIEKLYKESADEDKIITLLRRKFLENIVYVCISQLAYWLLWILPTKTADEHLEAPWSWLHSQGQNNMHALCKQTDHKDRYEEEAGIYMPGLFPNSQTRQVTHPQGGKRWWWKRWK